jgi:hypothetical protein
VTPIIQNNTNMTCWPGGFTSIIPLFYIDAANLSRPESDCKCLLVLKHLAILDAAASLLKRAREQGAPVNPRVHARRGEDGDDVSRRQHSFDVPVVIRDEAAAAA